MGRLCPDKGLGVGVVVLDIVVDGGGELGHTFEDTATNAVDGYFSEPTFNKIEPRRRRGDKMQVKAGMPDKPSLDPWMLVVIRARRAWRCSVRPERTILSSSALSSAVIASAVLLAHMPHRIAGPRPL